MEIVDILIKYYETNYKDKKYMSCFSKVKRKIKELHKTYVSASEDKTANKIKVFFWKHYIEVIRNEIQFQHFPSYKRIGDKSIGKCLSPNRGFVT